MAEAKDTKKSDVANDKVTSTQERNFDNARKTAAINHENDKNQNTVDGNEGVEVRELKPVEVINPVRNGATGELEDDTRTLKQTPEQALGVDNSAPKTETK